MFRADTSDHPIGYTTTAFTYEEKETDQKHNHG